MWVKFLKPFNWRPPEKRTCHIAYKAGMVQFVRVCCGAEAIQKGKAVRCDRPIDV